MPTKVYLESYELLDKETPKSSASSVASYEQQIERFSRRLAIAIVHRDIALKARENRSKGIPIQDTPSSSRSRYYPISDEHGEVF